MQRLSEALGPGRDDQSRLLAIRNRFAQAWADAAPGISVDLAAYLPPRDDPLFRSALLELIQIDLEQRWQRQEEVFLERYLQRFPELGTAKQLPVELIGQEFRLRLQYDPDLPAMQTYLSRFPEQFADLQRLLQNQSFAAAESARPATEAGLGTVPNAGRSPARGLTEECGYILVRPLGRGAFGQVFLAQAPGGIPAAVKIIHRDQQHPEQARVEQEALERIKHLRHIYLLQTQAFWSFPDRLVIAMELAECSLRDRYREARKSGARGLPARELLQYVRETAEALDFLHEQNLLHRDVKPDNILLVGEHVKVADFGLVCFLPTDRSFTLTDDGVGTPPYMAPEVWGDRRFGRVGPRSDQYSLAAAYAEMRLGRTLFRGDLYQMMRGHTEQRPDLQALPPHEAATLHRALAKHAEDRFESCAEFYRALRHALRLDEMENAASVPSPEPARPETAEPPRGQPAVPSKPGRMQRRGRPRRRRVHALALLIVILGSMLAAWAVNRGLLSRLDDLIDAGQYAETLERIDGTTAAIPWLRERWHDQVLRRGIERIEALVESSPPDAAAQAGSLLEAFAGDPAREPLAREQFQQALEAWFKSYPKCVVNAEARTHTRRAAESLLGTHERILPAESLCLLLVLQARSQEKTEFGQRQALQAYQRIANMFMSGSLPRLPLEQFCQEILRPGCQLAKSLLASSPRGEERLRLARWYGTVGTLLIDPQRDHWPDGIHPAPEAWQAFKIARELEPKNPLYLVGEGSARCEMPTPPWEDLERQAIQALQMDPKFAEAHAFRGYVRHRRALEEFDTGKALAGLQAAIDAYSQALAGPGPRVLPGWRGQTLARRSAALVERVRIEVDLHPVTPEKPVLERLAQAKSDAEQATASLPSSLPGWEALGAAQEEEAALTRVSEPTRSAGFRAALTAYDRIATMEPENAQYRLDRGRCRMRWAAVSPNRDQLVAEAIKDLQHALGGDASVQVRAESHYWLGLAYQAQQDFLAAEKQFEALPRLVDPEHARAWPRHSIAWARLAIQEGKGTASPALASRYFRLARQRAQTAAKSWPEASRALECEAFTEEAVGWLRAAEANRTQPQNDELTLRGLHEARTLAGELGRLNASPEAIGWIRGWSTELEGNGQLARSIYEEALKASPPTVGEARLQCLLRYLNLVSIDKAAADSANPARFEEAFSLAPEHPSSGRWCWHLAQHYQRARDLAQAQHWLKRAQERVDHLPPDVRKQVESASRDLPVP